MLRTKTFTNIIILILVLFVFTIFGQKTEPAKIDDFINPFAKANHFSGVVLAEKDGKIIYEKAFGFASVEHNVPNKLDTKFGIASITKGMTAVILIRLIEEKKLALTDKLNKYIPDFPKGEKITIEMLAKHLSGIKHRVMPEEEEAIRYTSAEFVEKVKRSELAFEPGTDDLYSSAGYAVLARVLEIAAGKTFDELLQKYVFEPANMTDSLDYDSRKIIKNEANCYLLESEGYTAAPQKDYSFLIGAGSVYSTARDVYKFGKANLEGKFGETTKARFTKGIFNGNGSTNGFRANMRIDTGKNYGYVLVSNLGSGANDLILKHLRNVLEGNETSSPEVPDPKVNKNVKNDLSDFVGRYKLGGSGFNILIDNNELYAGPYKLIPLGKDRFYNYWSYAEITFVRGKDGRVNGLEWVGSGGKSEWNKE